MRLSPEQVAAIRESAQEAFGDGTAVWLFGSRVDDCRRGGDVDLLVRPPGYDAHERLVRKLRFLAHLEQRLGERKVDVVIETPGDERPIVRIAHEQGVRLQ